MERIKQYILDGRFGAITLDTSIFDGNGLRLEKGLLKQLEQFKQGNPLILLSDIIYQELLSHIVREAQKTEDQLNKAIEQACDRWNIQEFETKSIRDSILGPVDVETHAQTRLNDYVQRIGALILSAEEFEGVLNEVTERYFKGLPPFASKESKKESKKYEFPDAIALVVLSKWAQKENTKVLAVTTDDDWKQFCDQSDYVYAIDDLGIALELFQMRAKQHKDAFLACEYISQNFPENDFLALHNALLNAMDDPGYVFDFIPDGDSPFYFDIEIYEISMTRCEIMEDAEGQILRPVQILDGLIVAEINMEIEFEVSADITFSVKDGVDKDYVPMGSNYKSATTGTSAKALITLIGDLSCDPKDLTIDGVEVIGKNVYVDFGSMMPDWEDE